MMSSKLKRLFIVSVMTALLLGTSSFAIAEKGQAYSGNLHVQLVQGQVQVQQLDSLNNEKLLEQIPLQIQDRLAKYKIDFNGVQFGPGAQPTDNGQKPNTEQGGNKQVAKPVPADEVNGTDQGSAADKSSDLELSVDEQKMVDLVNAERQKQGLSPLTVDKELVHVARVKAQDMIDNNYFAHVSPTYGSPFDMLNSFGVKYQTAGENLAGNASVEGAHQGLMNSDGHRANILGQQYGKVGIGIVNGGKYGKMFVQLFTN